METVSIILVTISVITLLAMFVAYFLDPKTKKKIDKQPLPDKYRQIMLEWVDFYQNLSAEKLKEFEERVELFLNTTHITGVKTTVEDLDRVSSRRAR